MTIEQFLEELSRTPRDWEFPCASPGIRRKFSSANICPILAVAAARGEELPRSGHRVDNGGAIEVGDKLGISWEDAHDIVAAADSTIFQWGAARLHQLRVKLLAACGLTEKGTKG